MRDPDQDAQPLADDLPDRLATHRHPGAVHPLNYCSHGSIMRRMGVKALRAVPPK
ncbi:hypothetical protein GCM10023347_06370 [Streptomyces chumphonensis]